MSRSYLQMLVWIDRLRRMSPDITSRSRDSGHDPEIRAEIQGYRGYFSRSWVRSRDSGGCPATSFRDLGIQNVVQGFAPRSRDSRQCLQTLSEISWCRSGFSGFGPRSRDSSRDPGMGPRLLRIPAEAGLFRLTSREVAPTSLDSGRGRGIQTDVQGCTAVSLDLG